MSITFTTWNIQNFTRPDPDSDSVYADKLGFLIATLQELDSDVIALQEVLDLDALEDIADGLGFHHFAASPDGRGNRVAFLTRDSLSQQEQQIDQWQLAQDVVIHRFDESGNVEVVTQFRRPALQVTIAHNGGEIDVITTHLKSKLLTFQGNFSTTNETLRAQTAYFALECRAAEATSLREHVTNLLTAGRNLVVLGDLNDGPEAATTQILYGPPGSQPRGPEDATHAAGAFQRADARDKQRLFNVVKFVPEEVRWSRKHNGQNELLDHILSSDGLMPRANSLRQVPTVSILNEDTPDMIGPSPTVKGVVPDHAPVTATFV